MSRIKVPMRKVYLTLMPVGDGCNVTVMLAKSYTEINPLVIFTGDLPMWSKVHLEIDIPDLLGATRVDPHFEILPSGGRTVKHTISLVKAYFETDNRPY